MDNKVTVLVTVKLAAGKSEADLLAASEKFQNEFVAKQPGILRRELIRTGDGQYTDIVLFKSNQDAQEVIAAEAESPACHELLSILDLTDMDMNAETNLHASLAVYS